MAAKKQQMPHALTLAGVVVVAYLWFFIFPRIHLSVLDYVIWAAVSAGLIGWHLITSRKAQSPESRAALFERHKNKYVFDEQTGQWFRKQWKNNIHGIDFYDRNRNTRAARLFKEDAEFKKEMLWATALYVMAYPLWLLYRFLHMRELNADLYNRIGMQPPKISAADTGVVWLIIALVGAAIALRIVKHLFYINGYDRMYDVEIPSALVLDPPADLRDLDGQHGPPVGEMPDTGPAIPEYRPNA